MKIQAVLISKTFPSWCMRARNFCKSDVVPETNEHENDLPRRWQLLLIVSAFNAYRVILKITACSGIDLRKRRKTPTRPCSQVVHTCENSEIFVKVMGFFHGVFDIVWIIFSLKKKVSVFGTANSKRSTGLTFLNFRRRFTVYPINTWFFRNDPKHLNCICHNISKFWMIYCCYLFGVHFVNCLLISCLAAFDLKFQFYINYLKLFDW